MRSGSRNDGGRELHHDRLRHLRTPSNTSSVRPSPTELDAGEFINFGSVASTLIVIGMIFK